MFICSPDFLTQLPLLIIPQSLWIISNGLWRNEVRQRSSLSSKHQWHYSLQPLDKVLSESLRVLQSILSDYLWRSLATFEHHFSVCATCTTLMKQRIDKFPRVLALTYSLPRLDILLSFYTIINPLKHDATRYSLVDSTIHIECSTFCCFVSNHSPWRIQAFPAAQ